MHGMKCLWLWSRDTVESRGDETRVPHRVHVDEEAGEEEEEEKEEQEEKEEEEDQEEEEEEGGGKESKTDVG